MKLEILNKFFQKYSNIKFHDNPPSGSRVVPFGRTDRQTNRRDAANSHFFLNLRMRLKPNIYFRTGK